jgi:hypothetical protein
MLSPLNAPTLAALCLIVCVASAQAQSPRNQNYRYSSQRPVQSRPAGPTQGAGQFEALKEQPRDLPYMPQITPPGSRFLFGMKKINDNGTINLSLRYGTAENGQAIIQYYAQSLKQFGWSVGSVTARNMTASYKGNTCAIQLAPGSGRQFPTDFQIIYQLRQQ